jgi:NADPH:quinone reductase-like Zn-dependent oxidoreductase
MGVVDATKDGIGLEGAGVVRGVGSGARDFKVGDRVIMFEHGCFSTRLAVSAKLCAKIPGDLSFEEAATLPCVYSTVIYSLLTVGRLEKGQVRGLDRVY